MKHLGLTLGPAILLAASLAACGDGGPRENTAEQLEEAAEQSDAAAAPILENAADRIREEETVPPDAAAQNALARAGNAQAETVE